MEWLIALLFRFIWKVLMYPIGLLRCWSTGKFKKSIHEVAVENSFEDLALLGSRFMFECFAGAGTLVLTVMLILGVSVMIYYICKVAVSS